MAEALRIGLIGAGAIGAWHARIVAERPDAVLAAICDIDVDRAARLAEPCGAAVFTDAAGMFANAGHAIRSSKSSGWRRSIGKEGRDESERMAE